MSLFVVDASVAVKWLFPEPQRADALRLQRPEAMLHAPDFIQLEVVNVVAKRLRRGLLPHEDASLAFGLARSLPVAFHSWLDLLAPAFRLAADTRRSMYDCLYLALAVRLDAQLVTADRKFFDALADGPFAAHLCWIEDVPTSPSTGD